MAIQGSLEEAPLPDVLQLLSLGKKSGCLALTEREMQGEICLDDGLVCHAAVFSRRDRLGDMLVRTGRITQQQLDDAVALEQREGRQVSQTLLASGQVERTELERFVRMQVEEAVYFMFTWRTGSFAFTSSVRPKRQEFLVAIDPEGLLLEGARRVDEWSLIQKKVPSLDLVFRLDRSRLDGAPTLTPEQQQIVPLIDGTRDVHGIIEMTGMPEFDVGKALYGLITAGFAKLVERRAAMRHLDYRELLAYVVREAEFAEPDRRRAAARHIADCATCTQRLKTIHVRRTGTVPALSTTTDEPERAPVPEPATSGRTADGPTLATGGVERRVGDRRVLDERRGDERRRGEERRKSRSPEWEQPGRDRRSGADRRVEGRRISERRMATIAGRESAAVVAARPMTLPQRSRSGERRVTGPRRIRPTEGETAPAHRKRDTGDGIRLLPADVRPAALPDAAAAPATAHPPERRPEADEAASAAPASGTAASDGTAEAGDRHAAQPADPHAETATAAPRVAREPKPHRRKARRPEPEVPELPAEAVARPQASTEPEDVAARSMTDTLAEQVERPAQTESAAPAAPVEGVSAAPEASMPGGDAAPTPPRPPLPSVEPHPRPVKGRPPARSTDIEWLVSPDEANHLLRTSRIGLAAPASETDVPAPRREAAQPKTPQPAKTERPDATPPATTRKAKSPRPPAVARPAPSAPPKPEPRRVAPAPEATAPARDTSTPVSEPIVHRVAAAARNREVAQPAPAGARTQPSPLRWIPIAAAAVVLIGIGWVARPLLQTDGSPPPAVAAPVVPQEAALGPVAAPVEAPPEATTTTPAVEVATPPAEPPRTATTARPAAREAAPPPARQPAPVVVPPPAVTTISGTVRDGASGAALAGVQVTIPGTAFSTVTDGSGRYTFPEVPAGRTTMAATLDGHVPGTRDVVLRAGESAQVDFQLTPPAPAPEPEPAPPAAAVTRTPTAVTAREADAELASGNWTVTDAATASARLRNTIATIPGLWVESIAITETGSRPRARVALLTPEGERIVLTETRSGAPVIGGTPRVTALRIIPGSEAYPVTTGTASFGSLLVTAKATLDPETLRALLTTLVELE